ncbi:unnamed protein product [Pseudo-nitzschia multistriata]|uniref:Uncharacterized protein n=1 Tax=Pseudo-nitzschia multistriata TaxID=183589 RepID=A0A448ZKQ5_9STRA|nr:unnamed protein product [Pseudo-nitzschia multistriata]
MLPGGKTRQRNKYTNNIESDADGGASNIDNAGDDMKIRNTLSRKSNDKKNIDFESDWYFSDEKNQGAGGVRFPAAAAADIGKWN